MKTKLIALIILTLLMPIGSAYAWGGGDSSDRLSNDQAGVFSPGYLNAAKQQAYNIVNQNNKPKGWWESLMDKVKDKTSNKIEKALIQLETAASKVKYQEADAELNKMKRGMDEIQDANVVDSLIKLAQEKFGYVQAVTDCKTALATLEKAVGLNDYFKGK